MAESTSVENQPSLQTAAHSLPADLSQEISASKVPSVNEPFSKSSSLLSAPVTSTHPLTNPASQDKKTGGGWLSNILANQTTGSSFDEQDEESNATRASFSPSKLLKRTGRNQATPSAISLSMTPKTSPSKHASNHQQAFTGRMTGLDRMFDRAMQYFVDSDSNVDRCPEDIFLLGVRHDGWRPETTPSGLKVPAGDKQVLDPSASLLPSSNSIDSLANDKTGRRRRSKSSSKRSRHSHEQSDSVAASSVRNARPWALPHLPPTRSNPGAFFSNPKSNSSHLPYLPATQAGEELPQRPLTPPSRMGSRTSSSSLASTSRASSTSSSSSLSGVHDSSTRSHFPTAATQDLSKSQGWPPSFYLDFHSRIQLTYRSNFSPISSTAPPALGNSSSGTNVTGVARAWTSVVNGLSASISRAGQGHKDDGLTSDAGWGCMLRTGQSLLANALVNLHLGRGDYLRCFAFWKKLTIATRSIDWRCPITNSPVSDSQFSSSAKFVKYVRLITWFMDDPSPLAPFSVHRFAAEGQRLGKQVGEWFGPSTAAGAIKNLANNFEPANLGIALAIDTTVYRSEVFAVARGNGDSKDAWSRPVLILVPLRLGLTGVNPIYFSSIKHYFTLPQCVGIAGGRPSSSYYFVGAQSDSLIYIDPHYTKPSVRLVPLSAQHQQAALETPLSAPSSSSSSPQGLQGQSDLDTFFNYAYPPAELASFHCQKVRKMSIQGLDPSMLVGFLCKTREDWEDLCSRMREIASQATPIVHIVQEMPAWMRNPSRSMSGMGSARAGNTNAKPARAHQSSFKTSGNDPVNAKGKADSNNLSPDDGDFMDYPDSDDWDIDDSEVDSKLNAEYIDEEAELSPQPSLREKGNEDYVQAEKEEEDWAEAVRPEIHTSQSPVHKKDKSALSALSGVNRDAVQALDVGTDAVLVSPSPANDTFPHSRPPRIPSDYVPLQPEDTAAGWDGMSLNGRQETFSPAQPKASVRGASTRASRDSFDVSDERRAGLR